MRSIETNGTFEDATAICGERARAIAGALRTLIGVVHPEAVEVPWPRQNVVGYGIGPKKMTEHFCYLGLATNHVNLGFNHGARLPDPAGILSGTGRAYRHVRCIEPADSRRPEIRELLQAAVSERLRAHE